MDMGYGHVSINKLHQSHHLPLVMYNKQQDNASLRQTTPSGIETPQQVQPKLITVKTETAHGLHNTRCTTLNFTSWLMTASSGEGRATYNFELGQFSSCDRDVFDMCCFW